MAKIDTGNIHSERGLKITRQQLEQHLRKGLQRKGFEKIFQNSLSEVIC